MPDLAYGDLIRDTRSNNASQTNALALIPVATDYNSVKLNKPYCTIEDLKAYIANSEYDDGFYAQAINQASRMVEKIAGRTFWYVDFRFKDYVPNKSDITEDRIYFPFPIRAISSIQVDSSNLDASDYYYVSVTDYDDPRNWYIEVVSKESFELAVEDIRFIKDEITSNIKVKGTFGYQVESNTKIPTDYNFPPDVRRATTMIAGTLTGKFMKQSVDLDGNRENILETMIPMDAVKLLKKSKRIIM